MVHILPSSWNFKDGETIRVLTWSNAKQVELFLDGKSLGKQDVPKAGHAEWQVPFAAGELRAVASRDGKTIATDIVQTAGKPARIKLTTERTKLRANAQDAVVVAATLYDDKGIVVPNADQRVTFAVKGDGKIIGVHNGNPADHDPVRADNFRSFHGKCAAVVQAGAGSGKIKITATSPNLVADTIELDVRAAE
jgi:beta-galactosidase